MGNNFYDQLDNLESDEKKITMNKEVEEKITLKKEKKWISFWKKNQKSFLSWISGTFWKDQISKVEISKKDLVVSGIWILLLLWAYMTYSTNVYGKIQELPKLEKNIGILNENLIKQENEKKALEEMTIEDDELLSKEKEILRFLPQENENVGMQQTFQILEIAKASNIKLWSIQKISEEMTDDKIALKDPLFTELWIDNFYYDVGINKFILSADASEDEILEFQRRIEESIGFSFQWFTINKSEEWMKYSVTLFWFYSLTQ